MDAIFNFDKAILLWIQNNLRGGILDNIMIFITHLGDKGLFWIVLTLLLLNLRKTRHPGVTSAIAMVIGLIVVNLMLKNLVARIRPYVLIEELELMIEQQKDFSFPSGHACNSFACAWALFRTMKKRYGVPALVLATLITLSRIYVGVHYPTDIIAGAAIGIAAAELARFIVKTLRRRFPAFKRFISAKGKAKG